MNVYYASKLLLYIVSLLDIMKENVYEIVCTFLKKVLYEKKKTN